MDMNTNMNQKSQKAMMRPQKVMTNHMKADGKLS